jgi:hypothetical protein
MATRWFSVIVDSADPGSLGAWWRDALDWQILYQADDEVVVGPADLTDDAGVPALAFVAVADVKQGKNRVHLDLASQTFEEHAAIVDRLLAVGASRADVGQGPDETWVVLADPEGNEFCVLHPREGYLAGGALAAVVMDVDDPSGVADFWVAATGRSMVRHEDGDVTLRHPDGRLPDLDLLRTGDPRTGKNRLHLDVAPGVDDDQAAEVARLVALGAAPVDVGQGPDVTWVVLADPEGNEFCVLSPR